MVEFLTAFSSQNVDMVRSLEEYSLKHSQQTVAESRYAHLYIY